MSISDTSGSSPEAQEREGRLALEVLLADANRLRAGGRLGDAVAKCREALAKDGNFWKAYELMGDLLRQQRLVTAAIEAYQAAKALNPRRVALEDKIARACAVLGLQQYALANPAYLPGEQSARKPVLAAFLSLVFPGLGQLYNRQALKALVVLGATLIMVLFLALVALAPIAARRAAFSLSDVAGAFVSGQALYFCFIIAGLWIYSIADAALQAARSAGSGERAPFPAMEG